MPSMVGRRVVERWSGMIRPCFYVQQKRWLGRTLFRDPRRILRLSALRFVLDTMQLRDCGTKKSPDGWCAEGKWRLSMIPTISFNVYVALWSILLLTSLICVSLHESSSLIRNILSMEKYEKVAYSTSLSFGFSIKSMIVALVWELRVEFNWKPFLNWNYLSIEVWTEANLLIKLPTRPHLAREASVEIWNLKVEAWRWKLQLRGSFHWKAKF